MAPAAQNQAQIDRIADAIVDLVEQANGPVFFSEIDEKVPGFHKPDDPAYAYFAGHEGIVVWDGMTETGLEALQSVLRERRVALQMVRTTLPLILNTRIAESAAPPYVLLPVRAANIDTPNFKMRVSPQMQRRMMAGASTIGNTGFRPLTPVEVGATADQFSF